MDLEDVLRDMPETIEFKGSTYRKDDKILGYGENVAVAYFQQGGIGAIMAFYNQRQIVYTPDGRDIQLISILDDFTVESVLNGIEQGERFAKGVKKMKKGWRFNNSRFNNSRFDAFRDAADAEFSSMLLLGRGSEPFIHEETKLDDTNYVMVIEGSRYFHDFELNAVMRQIEQMGFKIDYYTDMERDGRIIYQINAIDNHTHGYESLLDEPVEVVDGKHDNHYTLREAIEVFGISSEPDNLDDARVFARCPYLKGLCGPMAPNSGYVARYETQEVCDFLSVSRRKSTYKMKKSDTTDFGLPINDRAMVEELLDEYYDYYDDFYNNGDEYEDPILGLSGREAYRGLVSRGDEYIKQESEYAPLVVDMVRMRMDGFTSDREVAALARLIETNPKARGYASQYSVIPMPKSTRKSIRKDWHVSPRDMPDSFTIHGVQFTLTEDDYGRRTWEGEYDGHRIYAFAHECGDGGLGIDMGDRGRYSTGGEKFHGIEDLNGWMWRDLMDWYSTNKQVHKSKARNMKKSRYEWVDVEPTDEHTKHTAILDVTFEGKDIVVTLDEMDDQNQSIFGWINVNGEMVYNKEYDGYDSAIFDLEDKVDEIICGRTSFKNVNKSTRKGKKMKKDMQLASLILQICDYHGRLDTLEGSYEKAKASDDPMNTPIGWLVWCRDCGEEYTFEATVSQMERLVLRDGFVQDVFPDMSPEMRDVVRVRGVFCPACFKLASTHKSFKSVYDKQRGKHGKVIY